MTTDELKAFLEENKADIESAVKAKLIAGLLENHRWDISAAITKTVEDFVAAEIVPAVKAHLTDQKGPIIEAAVAAAAQMGEALSMAIATHTAKRLTPGGYEFRAVLKALFE